MASTPTASALYNHYLISFILILAALGGGYAMGIKYEKGKVVTTTASTTTDSTLGLNGGSTNSGSGGPGNFGGGAGGSRFNRGGGPGGDFTSGTVLSKTDNGITIQGTDGTTKTIAVSDATTISQTSTIDLSSLSIGQTVTVIGATAGDGSIDARSIQVRPANSTTLGGGTAGSL